MNHKRFPLFFDLTKKDILFVGGGSIALRRIKTLLPFVDSVSVITVTVSAELSALAKECLAVKLVERAFDLSDLKGRDMVFACTGDEGLNAEIAAECKKQGIPVNNCSKKEDCDFYFPGIVEMGNVVVGVTASGEDHKKAKEIRERIGELLEQI